MALRYAVQVTASDVLDSGDFRSGFDHCRQVEIDKLQMAVFGRQRRAHRSLLAPDVHHSTAQGFEMLVQILEQLQRLRGRSIQASHVKALRLPSVLGQVLVHSLP
ncbi:hypothetical protein Mapa_015113 [Marchantia paleacea]|nr:hypothetical protein Mapa_015113 [Marchantia paleacea]